MACILAVGRQTIPQAGDRDRDRPGSVGGRAVGSVLMCSSAAKADCSAAWCWCCCLDGGLAGVGSVEPSPVSLAPGSLHLQLSFSSVQMG